jgi:DNA-binding XRE family transcriptional regulator
MKKDTNRVQVSPAKMPASKSSHVLSVLRKNLALRQTELAKMVGCSVNTITSIEVGRLKLSESLAKRIAAVTGCDEQWLLAGDISVPMPNEPLAIDVTGRFSRGLKKQNRYVYTIYLLSEVFSRLFAEVRKLEKTSIRDELEDRIRKELKVLEKTQTDPDARPLYSVNKEMLQVLHILQNRELPSALLNLGINLERLIETAPETKTKSPPEHKKAPTSMIDALINTLSASIQLPAETSLDGNKRIFPKPAVSRTRRST